MNLVSIIIPAYNAEKYISDSITSVLLQSINNWELIIINDGSTDNTEAVIKGFAKDNRIKYFYQNNTGVSGARNNGINNASGEFIAFLDADDSWLPDNLLRKIEILNNHDSIFWVFSDMYHADEKLDYTGITAYGTDEDILNNILLWEKEVVPGPCSNIVAKSQCFKEMVRFDPLLSLAADKDFCLQLGSKFKGKRIAKPLFYYRNLPKSMSRNLAIAQHDSILLFNKAKKNNLFHSFGFKQKCFSNLYFILAGNWWKVGKSRIKGMYFILLAIIYFPPNIIKLIKKF